MADESPSVGSLRAKVTPDTKGFGAELKARLAALERNLKIKVEIVAGSFDNLRDEVRASGRTMARAKADARGLGRALKQAGEDAKGGIKTGLNEGAAKDLVRQVREAVAKIHQEVPVGAGLDPTVHSKLTKELEKIRASVDVDADLTETSRLRLKQLIAETRGKVDAVMSRQSLERIKAELDAMRGTMRTEAELDNGARAKLKAQLETVRGRVGVDAYLSESARRRLQRDMDALDRDVDKRARGDAARQARASALAAVEQMREQLAQMRTELRPRMVLTPGHKAEVKAQLEEALATLRTDVSLPAHARRQLMAQVHSLIGDAEKHGIRLKADLDDNDVRRKAEALGRKYARTRMMLNPQSDTMRATRKLDALARKRDVVFRPVLDRVAEINMREALGRLAESVRETSIAKGLSNGVKRATKFTSMWTGVLIALAPVLLSVSSAAFSAASGIVSMTGQIGVGLGRIGAGAIALPGIIAGTALGFKSLSLAAAYAKQNIAGAVEAQGKLAQILEVTAWKRAGATLQRAFDLVMGRLEKGVVALGEGAGDIMNAVGRAFSTGRSLNNISSFLRNTADGMKNMARGAGAFTRSLTDLFEFGARYLPQMAAWISDIAEGFEQWLRAAIDSGQAHEWVQRAVDELGHLYETGKNALRIVTAIGRAFQVDASSGFAGVAETLDKIARGLENPTFQNAMKSMVDGAQAGMAAMTPGLRAFGGALASLADVVGPAMEYAGEAFSTFLTALGAGLQSDKSLGGFRDLLKGMSDSMIVFADAMGPITGILGGLGHAIGAMAPQMARVGVAVLGGLEPVLTRLFDGLAEAAPWIGDVMVQAVETLLPVITMLMDALAPLAPEFKALVEDGLKYMLPAIVQLVRDFAPLITIIGGVLIEALRTLMPLLPGLGETLGKLAEPLGRLFEALGPVAGALITSFVSIIEALAPVFGQLVDAIIPILPVITDLIKMFADWVADNPELAGTILMIIGAMFLLVPIAMKVMGAISTVVTAVEGLWKMFGLAWAAVGVLKSALGPVGSVLGKVGGFFLGLLNGPLKLLFGFLMANPMLAAVGLILGALAMLLMNEDVREWLGNLISDFANWATELGKGVAQWISDLFGGLVEIMRGPVDALGNLLRAPAQAMMDALQGVYNWVVETLIPMIANIPKAIGEGIGNIGGGIGDAAGWVGDKVKGAAGWVGDGLGLDGSGFGWGGPQTVNNVTINHPTVEPASVSARRDASVANLGV